MTSAGGARTVLDLARAEASLLVRSLLVLAGLLASGAVVWVLFGSVQPLWWNAAWQIGFGQHDLHRPDAQPIARISGVDRGELSPAHDQTPLP